MQLPDYASYETHHCKLLKNLLMQKNIYKSVAAIFSIILIISFRMGFHMPKNSIWTHVRHFHDQPETKVT